ncbi:lycopene cyclase domain-containing protein [Carboxylicivirga linearis]|uniref:Lycopene cyclase domain-containing protein n=1 Tax=Carboxylicivirga linearis TaxID=1628157 RepID=A0ABS5JQ06_9BACT|nr:lycopene cyclase domain-containing protein [Carboxylicivirga linearis]MBS2096920.1 lycopene cyclase domain-containing protein [Carboxylicivirga linearis]
MLVDLFCILVPFIASFYPKHSFYKEWKYFLPANLAVAFFFLIWDYLFTEAGIWGFNPDYLTGIYLGNLPIEEILFFICIPYAVVFTYFAIQYLFAKNWLTPKVHFITGLLVVVFISIGLYFYNRLYTTITLISTGIYLLVLLVKRKDISWIYFSYLLIIPFFLASNGVLTGSWIDEPIVWYNNAENMGLRIGTIPIEDSVYGFLLVLMNIQLYEFIKKGKKKTVE